MATKRFTVSAGRQINCDGRPFISVTRDGDTRPTTADALTHKFARDLNRSKIKCDARLNYEDFLGFWPFTKKKKAKRRVGDQRIYYIPSSRGGRTINERAATVISGARRRKRRRR